MLECDIIYLLLCGIFIEVHTLLEFDKVKQYRYHKNNYKNYFKMNK